MLNGFFMFAACQTRAKVFKYIGLLSWIILFVSGAYKTLFSVFNLLNLLCFLVCFAGISVLKKKKNLILSALSVLAYSVLIDVVCYFYFPFAVSMQSLLAYIASGIMFNLKGIIVPIICSALIIIYDYFKQKEIKPVTLYKQSSII